MPKSKAEIMKQSRADRKAAGWIEVRGIWVRSQAKADQLKRQFPPPTRNTK